MTTDEMQKFGKATMETALTSFGACTKSAQAIAVEVVDYSKKSLEDSAAAWERLVGARTLEKAMEVQSEYLKSSYEDFVAEATKLGELYVDLDFVAEATKLGELYVDLAKEAYKPFEGALAKASAMK